jgi:hypothetical protein
MMLISPVIARDAINKQSFSFGIAFGARFVTSNAMRLNVRRMVLGHRKGVLSFQNRIANVSDPQHRCQ